MLSDLKYRLRALFRRQAMERELDDELRFHLEQERDKESRRGDSAAAARRAHLALGGLEATKEACRDARGVAWLEEAGHDLRFGARMLRKNPGFTLIVVVTLALGVGANTAIFSTVNALLLRPVPLKDPDRLVFGMALREGFDPFGTSALEYALYRDQATSFESSGLAMSQSFNLAANAGLNAEPERLQGVALSPGFLETLGTQPYLGRPWTADENKPGGPPLVLISYDFWQRRFGGDRAALGRSLDMEGRSYTVIGVMPPGFDYPYTADLWVPMQINLDTLPLDQRQQTSYYMVGRLRQGATLESARTELRALARRLEQEYPQVRRGWTYGLNSVRQELLGDSNGRVVRSLLVLMLAVGVLLLICCVNIAGLLLVRGTTRERELAIRVALGAASGRVTRQLLTEGLLLSLLGGGLGLLLAYGLAPLLRALNPIQVFSFRAFLGDFAIDRRVLLFSFFISIASGVLFSMLPALRSGSRRDPIQTLRRREHRVGGAAAGRGWLRVLVVGEIALAIALLFAGGLMVRSFRALQHLELGFRPENLLMIPLPLSPSRYPTQAQQVAFADRLLERVRALPGVVAAGTTSNVPLQDISIDSFFTVEGRPFTNPADVPITGLRFVSPGYVEALGLPLVRGRLITAQDRAETMPVVVITEELERQGWGGDSALGKHVRRGRAGQTNFPWMTVVGVVKDAKEDRFNFRIPRPVWYIPASQRVGRAVLDLPVNLVVRTSADPESVAGAVRAAVHAIDPNQPVMAPRSMESSVSEVLMTDRFSARVMGSLAGLGLFLAALGLYGVMAYSVSQRTGEFGLRMALGARPWNLFKQVAGEGGLLAAIGLLLGAPAALALSHMLAGALFNVRPTDPGMLAAIAGVLAAVALAACLAPARRATRVDPMVALRWE